MVLRKKSQIQSDGFTLIEILIAMAIFSIVASLAIGIFTMAMKSQRKVLAQQELLDQASYVMEYMSRAIRMAKKDDGSCLSEPPTVDRANFNYFVPSDRNGIYFRNSDNECYGFGLLFNRLASLRGPIGGGSIEWLTGGNIKVNFFKVSLSGEQQPPTDFLQPAVTIFLDAEGKEGTKIQIQTTVSQRNLDVQY